MALFSILTITDGLTFFSTHRLSCNSFLIVWVIPYVVILSRRPKTYSLSIHKCRHQENLKNNFNFIHQSPTAYAACYSLSVFTFLWFKSCSKILHAVQVWVKAYNRTTNSKALAPQCVSMQRVTKYSSIPQDFSLLWGNETLKIAIKTYFTLTTVSV